MSKTVIRTPADPATLDPSDEIKVPAVKKRQDARAVKRILDRESREVVGWLYEWNTGEREPMWKHEKCEDVIYE